MELFVGINGIRSNGATNTDQLLLQLYNKYDCKIFDFNYGKVNIRDVLFKLRHRNDLSYEVANLLISRIKNKNNINLIAHSFGGLISIRTLELGLNVNNVFLFSPAADHDMIIPTDTVSGNVYIIHHPRDLAILLGSGLIYHDFGSLGRVGYLNKENNPKVINVNCKDVDKNTYEFSLFNLIGLNHGNYFRETNIDKWTDFICQKCNLKDL